MVVTTLSVGPWNEEFCEQRPVEVRKVNVISIELLDDLGEEETGLLFCSLFRFFSLGSTVNLVSARVAVGVPT